MSVVNFEPFYAYIRVSVVDLEHVNFAEHLQFRITPFREQPLSCFEKRVFLYFRKYMSKLFREGV